MNVRICMFCHTNWPCRQAGTHLEQGAVGEMPLHREESIACFVLDHSECSVGIFCKCHCHERSVLDEDSISVPPSNR